MSVSHDEEIQRLIDKFTCTREEADELWAVISYGDNFQSFQRAIEWLNKRGLLKEAL